MGIQCWYHATILHPLCNHHATIMQSLCNDQATLEAVGYRNGDGVETLRTKVAATSLGHSDPALGFHLEPRQGTRWKENHWDTEVQGGLKRLLQPKRQRSQAGAIRCGFHFERQLGHGAAAIELDAIFSDLGIGTHDFFYQAGVDVHP